MFPVIRYHKNALHLRIMRNSPEANSSRSIAHFGQPPGFWFKAPDGFGCCTEEAISVCTGDSAKPVGTLKLRQQNFRVVFLFRSISSSSLEKTASPALQYDTLNSKARTAATKTVRFSHAMTQD